MSTNQIDHTAERDASYKVRDTILAHTPGWSPGHDGTGYATTVREIHNYAPDHPKHASIPAGTRCKVTTTNAGFRGIEASAEAPDGTKVHGISLGAFRPGKPSDRPAEATR